jgi:hypothetical protein
MQKNNFKKNLLIVLISSIISAILYRLGGFGKPFKSWMRDWLIPPLAYFLLLFWWHPATWLGWGMWLIAIALSGGALTTYWDKLFGNIDNFFMHGWMVGLGAIPFAFVGLHWWAILIRAIILCLSMGLINKYVNKWQLKYSDWIEELSRGFLILITIPILLL